MNHWGQVPAAAYCCAKTVSSARRTTDHSPAASSHSTDPWQTSRTPQAAPPCCSRPCGVEKWIAALCTNQGRTSASLATLPAAAFPAPFLGDGGGASRMGEGGGVAGSNPRAHSLRAALTTA